MRKGVALLVAVAVLTVGLSVLAGIGLQHASHQSSLDSERTQVATLAGQYAVDFTSVDYRNLQNGFNAAAKNATPDFAKKYLQFMQAFTPLYTKGHVVQTTSVERAGISSISATSAVVLVALKGVATNTKTTTGTTVSYRMQVSLTRIDGKWLTANVVPV